MVVYFVELEDNVTQTTVFNSVSNMKEVEFEGIVNKYRNSNNRRVAIFNVGMGAPQLKFKRKYPESSPAFPDDLPKEIVDFYKH